MLPLGTSAAAAGLVNKNKYDKEMTNNGQEIVLKMRKSELAVVYVRATRIAVAALSSRLFRITRTI